MMRTSGGVLAGLVLAMLTIFIVEAIGHGLFPPPPGTGIPPAPVPLQTPAGLHLLVLAGWTLGAFLGAAAADRIGRRGLPGYVVAALVAAAGAWTTIDIPHPIWMQAGGILLPFAAAFLAERVTHRRF